MKARTLHQLLPLVLTEFKALRKHYKSAGLCAAVSRLFIDRKISLDEAKKLNKEIDKQIPAFSIWIDPLPQQYGGYSKRVQILEKLIEQRQPKKKPAKKQNKKVKQKTKAKA